MKPQILPLKNSAGFLVPKELLEAYGLDARVEMVVEPQGLIIRPKRNPREGWEEAFKRMAAAGDDELLIPDVFEDENFDFWT